MEVLPFRTYLNLFLERGSCMSKLKKIIETIVTFLVGMIGICFAFALYKVWAGDILPQDIFNETGLYFLYTTRK